MPLCPIEIPGISGSPPPMTFHPGATRCAIYLREGFDRDLWGSLAKIGKFDSDFSADIAQLLLPIEYLSFIT